MIYMHIQIRIYRHFSNINQILNSNMTVHLKLEYWNEILIE